MNKFSKILSFLPMVVLSGCMAGPDFEKPEYQYNKQFSQLQSAEVLKQNQQKLTKENLVDWWKLFGDDNLTWLIEEALRSNFDLETARARVEQAKAALSIKKS